jgi:hypothetical protein
MLHTVTCDLMSITDNIGSAITDAGFGTTANSGGSTHQKGTPVSLITGSLVTDDVYGMAITFCGGNLANSIRRYLADILIDTAGGSSWSVLINNLFVNNASLIQGGYRYYFPIYLHKGTSIGFQHQCNLATTALRCGVQLYGKPSRPELIRVGTKVHTYGAVLASTSGTAFTPGTSVIGAYTQIGTCEHDAWWWQWGGVGYNESAFGANSVFGDVAIGDDNNKRTCVDNCVQTYTAAEQAGKDAFGMKTPARNTKAGELIYVRGASVIAPETTPTTIVYCLG